MNLQDRLATDLKDAIKKGDGVRRSVIRLVKAGIKNVEIERMAPVDDSGVIEVIGREVKRHRESIAEFRRGNRPDLVAKEEAELAILLTYLPEQISKEEIVLAARQVIEEVGAHGPGDKGKVMPRLIAQLKGKADGRTISDVVSELLSG